MSADVLLSRLDGVRQSAPDRWVAKCPGHEDKSPSLSIREASGKTLIHCFAGCSSPDVLAAVGLSLCDLFPKPLTLDETKPTRPNHWHAANIALRVMKHEALIVALAAENVAQGVSLGTEDRERLIQAASRIRAAAEVVA